MKLRNILVERRDNEWHAGRLGTLTKTLGEFGCSEVKQMHKIESGWVGRAGHINRHVESASFETLAEALNYHGVPTTMREGAWPILHQHTKWTSARWNRLSDNHRLNLAAWALRD
jgi:hypothetical protein